MVTQRTLFDKKRCGFYSSRSNINFDWVSFTSYAVKRNFCHGFEARHWYGRMNSSIYMHALLEDFGKGCAK